MRYQENREATRKRHRILGTRHQTALRSRFRSAPRLTRLVEVVSSILLVLASLPVSAASDSGSRLLLTTGNDLFAGNPFDDDLYTASLALQIEKRGISYSLEERMFTDKDAGQRFDETWLTVSAEVPAGSRWRLRPRLGAVHIGRGLIGESGQNSIHRLIGDEEIDLRYVDQDRVHAVVALKATRSLRSGARRGMDFVVDAQQAVGFGRHAQIGVRGEMELSRLLQLHWDAGYRWSSTRQVLLDRHLRDGNMVLGIGVVVLDRFVFDWTYNRYGTGTRHLTFGYRLPVGGDERRSGR